MISVLIAAGCQSNRHDPAFRSSRLAGSEVDFAQTIASQERIRLFRKLRDPKLRVLSIRLGAANMRVALVGPSKVSTQALGYELKEILGRRGDNGDLSVWESAGFNVAYWKAGFAKLGVVDARDAYDLTDMLRRFGGDDQPRFVFIRIPGAADRAVFGLRRTRDVDSVVVYRPVPGAARVRAEVSMRFGWATYLRVVLRLSLPFCLGLALLALAFVIGRTRAPVEMRRNIYVWVAYPAAFLGLVLPFWLVLSPWRSPSPLEREMFQSMGLNFSQLARGWTAAVMGMPFAALLGELLVFPPRPSKRPKVRRFFAAVWPARFVWTGFFLAVVVAGIVSPAEGSSIYPAWIIPLMNVWAFLPNTEDLRPAPELAETARKLGNHFGVPVEDVTVLSNATGWQVTNAFAFRDGSVVITGKAYADFNAKQLKFLLAHEIAHIARFSATGMNGFIQLTLSFCGFLAFICLLSGVGGWAFGVLLACSFAGAFCYLVKTVKACRALESAVDCDAVRCTRDVEAAVSALEVLEGPSSRGEWLSSHPTKEHRIAAVRACAAEMGLGG